jgi:hypothetical protein
VAATTATGGVGNHDAVRRLYEQVAERKGGTYCGRVDGGLVLRRRTTWPFKVPGSSSQVRQAKIAGLN